MKSYTRRDLTVIPDIGGNSLVIACDSCGAVGTKKEDILKLSARYTSKFTTRVALTEVICSGATPITIVNGAACEMDPTGAEMILGIQDELKNAGISDIALTGSTEENFMTNMTALAVTVIGIAAKDELKFGQAIKGDKLILLGSPQVGAEVNLESKGFYTEIRQLLPLPGVREIVPVGSKGIVYEAKNLASINDMIFEYSNTETDSPTQIDYYKSAGPATCLLVLCSESAVNHVLNIYPNAITIGEMH